MSTWPIYVVWNLENLFEVGLEGLPLQNALGVSQLTGTETYECFAIRQGGQ
jgi:hypothetical protein